MAQGSRALSEKYGGTSFAMHVKGLEIAGYDPRGSFGHGLAYAVANRGGCHLSAFLVAQEVFLHLLRPHAARAKADYVKFFESLDNCVNSLQTCLFTLFAYLLEPPITKYTPDLALGLLMQELPQVAIPLIDYTLYRDFWSAVTGIKMSRWEYLEAGDRITVLERYMNTQEGIWRLHDTLPDRFLREGRKSDAKARTVPLEKTAVQVLQETRVRSQRDSDTQDTQAVGNSNAHRSPNPFVEPQPGKGFSHRQDKLLQSGEIKFHILFMDHGIPGFEDHGSFLHANDTGQPRFTPPSPADLVLEFIQCLVLEQFVKRHQGGRAERNLSSEVSRKALLRCDPDSVGGLLFVRAALLVRWHKDEEEPCVKAGLKRFGRDPMRPPSQPRKLQVPAA